MLIKMLRTLKLFEWGINSRSESVMVFGAAGRPFKVNPSAIIDTTGVLSAEGALDAVQSVMEEAERRSEKTFYLQRESPALGDILMLVPVVRYLATLGFNTYVRTWSKFVELLKTFGVYGEVWQEETSRLGLLTDGIVERDHWDKHIGSTGRIELLMQAVGLENIPTHVDWSYDAVSLPDVRFATRWVVVQAVGASPQRSLAPATAQALIKLMNKDAINAVVIGEDKQLSVNGAQNLLRYRQDSLVDLMAWIAGAAAVITTDSAPLWFAHFTKTPTFLLLGTSDAERRLSLHPDPSLVTSVELYKMVGCERSCHEQPKRCGWRYDCMRQPTAEQIYEAIRPELLYRWHDALKKCRVMMKVAAAPSTLPKPIADIFCTGPRLRDDVGGQTWYDEFHNPVNVKPGAPIPSWVIEKHNVSPELIHPDSLRLEGAFDFAARHKGHFTVAITRDMNGRGDVLMAAVIAKALKDKYGDAVAVWMAVKPGHERLLQGNPWVEKIYSSESQMHLENPDVKMNVNDLEFRAELKAYESEGRVMKNRTTLYLEGMGLSLVNKTPLYVVTEEERHWAVETLLAMGYDLSKPIIGLQYRGSNITRTYPHMDDVEIKLTRSGFQTFCLDGQSAGRYDYDLAQIGALVEQMAVVVTPNSFFYHLAGAMKRRAVVLFGSETGELWTEDYEKATPLQIACPSKKPRCWWELTCLPGTTLRQKEQTHTPACLEQIPAGRVVEEVERHLLAPRRILVVVLTWNLLELTKKTIDSVRSFHNYDLLVLDNGSTDGTIEWLKDQHIAYASQPCTVPEAWNAGMRQALKGDYDYALLCNNDIILSPTYIDIVIEVAERRALWAVTGAVFNRNESTLDKFVYQTQNVEQTLFAIGSGDYSAVLLSKECMKNIGAFDGRFSPRYQSDEDHALRLRLLGHSMLKTFKTTFYHMSGAVMLASPETSLQYDAEWKANVELFKQKWHVDPYAERSLCSNDAEMKKRNCDWRDKISISLKEKEHDGS